MASLLQRHAHLFLVGFGLGFNGQRDDRFGKTDAFQQDWGAFVTKSVASAGVLQADQRPRFHRKKRFQFLRAGWRASAGRGQRAL